MLSFLQISRPIDPIYSETIFTIFGYKINNTTLLSIFILFLFAFICFFVIRKFKLKPNKIQIVIEMIYELIENLVFQITGSKRETKIILPFIGSIFLFILFSNLLPNIPGLTSFIYDGKAIFRSPTSDFSTTFSLALAALIVIQIISIKDFGILEYISKFIKIKDLYLGFRKGIKEGMLALINFFVGFLDIIGELAKLFSVSLRLFGNIYAGMVLATVVSGIMAYILPSILQVMGLLVAVVQAIVFTSLITVYYVMAIKTKPEEEPL